MRAIQLLCMSLMLGTCGSAALAQDDFREQVKAVTAAEKQTSFISQFAQAAAANNADLMLEMTWPAARKNSGDKTYSDHFNKIIAPYFSNFVSIDSYQGLSPIVMDDVQKTAAVVHFGYLRDVAGKRKPFEMVVVTTDQGPFLANIIVGRCIKGHHPVCE